MDSEAAEKIFITENHSASSQDSWVRAYGSMKAQINLYPGWDSPEEDKRIEDMFEALQNTKSE